MTRKTDKRRLASFSLEEAHIMSSINIPPPPPQTRTLNFKMLYDVKSGVSFLHVHCDYGHAYLTSTIWSGKETTTTAFPLDVFVF